jgi:hypothetical protein
MGYTDPHLSELSDDHRERLQWFRDRSGTEIGWPGMLSDGRPLCTRAKGIYKPKGWDYALSIRQSLKDIYPDRDPITDAEGRWSYQYHQEYDNEEDFARSYGNLGLMKCMEDAVPVAVFMKTVEKPARYWVMGLAKVSSYSGGYFHLQGIDRKKRALPERPSAEELVAYRSKALPETKIQKTEKALGNADLLKAWIIEALEYYGGTAKMVRVSQWIWENRRDDLEDRGDFFFRWQYELRWAATSLRQEGILLPANHSERGIWVLSSAQ